VQDYALIRTMLNMLIASPGEENYHGAIAASLGPGNLIKTDEVESKKIILTTGTALKIGKKLQKLTDDEFSVMTMPLSSMQCKEEVAQKISNFEEIMILEDHMIDGGFGSWILESLSNRKDLYSKVTIKALDSKICGMVGTQDSLNKEGGIDPIKILESISLS